MIGHSNMTANICNTIARATVYSRVTLINWKGEFQQLACRPSKRENVECSRKKNIVNFRRKRKLRIRCKKVHEK